MRKLTTWLIAWAILLCGCGVQTQRHPEPIAVPIPPTTGPDAPPAGDGPSVTVFFVRGARLEPALRSVPFSDYATALSALATGPTRREVVSGIRTALAPQTFTVTRAGPGVPTLVIDVPREFTGVTGGNQLLAVAQLVWTVTEFPDIRLVRLTSEGESIEVPTDRGLSDWAVGRDDYRTVAPPATAPVPTSTPPPPSSTSAVERDATSSVERDATSVQRACGDIAHRRGAAPQAMRGPARTTVRHFRPYRHRFPDVGLSVVDVRSQGGGGPPSAGGGGPVTGPVTKTATSLRPRGESVAHLCLRSFSGTGSIASSGRQGRGRARTCTAGDEMNASGSRSADLPGPTIPVGRRPPPGFAADILREAWRPGVGEPVTIHVRPAVHARLLAETQAAVMWHAGARGRRQVSLVVDDQIPASPGYEIHRDIGPQELPCAI